MKYLMDFNFTEDEINSFCENVPPVLLETLMNSYKLVSSNINTLKELGITSIKEIFINNYDMFLMDHSNFLNIFNKYEKEDLVEKLNTTPEIIEFL